MASPTTSFFDDLARRGHVSWLEHEHGRLRFEVMEDQCLRQWTVAVDDGDLGVSQGDADADADAVVRVDRELFDRVVRGEENLLAAALRGEVTWRGRLDLIAQAGWLVPGPQGQAGPMKVNGGGGGRDGRRRGEAAGR